MNMLSKKALVEFREIWKKEIGTELSDEKTLEEAMKLIKIVKLIYKPILKNN